MADNQQDRIQPISAVNSPSYAEDGFEIHSPFSAKLVSNAEIDFYNRLLLQAYKLGVVESFDYRNYGDEVPADAIDRLVLAVNGKNKRSVDFAVQELRECPAYYGLVNERFLHIASQILKCPPSLLKIHFDGILVNLPSNKTRLYRYHSENHYYPFRKNFFNFWMPVIRDKTQDNGAMLIKHKGHKRSYSFNEYSGFDKIEGYDSHEENYFYQLELPENELKGLQTLLVDLKIGEGLFFSSNTPHSSVLNSSTTPSYALIARVYDYRRDLTLSDRSGIKLYSGASGGYPGIRPVD